MRSRNIKPGFFKNEFLAECDPLARVLFAGLWCMADREGRMEYRPKRMKAELLPYDNVKIERLLDQLVKHDFIVMYKIGDEKYLQIQQFSRHQNPHCKELASTIQAPDKNSTSPADSFNLIPDSLNIDSIGKPSLPEKIKYGDYVEMKESEYLKLISRFSETAVKGKIEEMDNYVIGQSLQKKYKDHYRTILEWLKKDAPKSTAEAMADKHAGALAFARKKVE